MNKTTIGNEIIRRTTPVGTSDGGGTHLRLSDRGEGVLIHDSQPIFEIFFGELYTTKRPETPSWEEHDYFGTGGKILVEFDEDSDDPVVKLALYHGGEEDPAEQPEWELPETETVDALFRHLRQLSKGLRTTSVDRVRGTLEKGVFLALAWVPEDTDRPIDHSPW